MAREHVVKAAQKDQGNCIHCHKPMKKGKPYAWVKASRFSQKYKRHVTCPPFTMMHMEGNEKKAQVYQAQADLQSAIQAWGKDPKGVPDLNDLKQAFDDAIGEVEEAVGAWEESWDNLPEGFQQGDTGQQIEELKDQAQAYADALGDFKDSVEEWEAEGEEGVQDWTERVKEEADQAAGELEF